MMCRLTTLLFLFMSLIIAPSCLVAKPMPGYTPLNRGVRPLHPQHPQKHYKPLPYPRVKYGEYCYYVQIPKPHYECESYHIRRNYTSSATSIKI
jgi:hypothetical protein